MRKLWIGIWCLVLGSSFAWSAPSVSSVSGTISDGQTITISGSQFGANGPQVHFYDDFESGQVGQQIKTGPGSATLGQWNRYPWGSPGPEYTNQNCLSGTSCFIADNSGGSQSTEVLLPPGGVMDVFVSFWAQLPAGTNFPGEGAPGQNVNWKVTWLMASTTGDNAYWIPGVSTITGSGTIQANGNPPSWTSAWLNFNPKGQWKRVSYWVDGEYDSSGHIDFWQMDNSGVSHPVNKDGPILTAGKKFQKLYVNGYSYAGPNSTPMFDDVYVAVGPNARARVEIGDQPVYANCTKMTILTPTSWSDGVITANVHQGPFGPNDSAYLFIVDGQGVVTSQGYPLTWGGASGPPPPPTNATLPSPPQSYVDTTIDPAYDRPADIVVNAGGNLQAAFNAAKPGDIIEIEAGARFIGNFNYPKKTGNEWVYVRTSRYSELPNPGDRVGPQHAHLMPKLETRTTNIQALRTDLGAHHVRFIGIEFISNSHSNAHVITLGPGYPHYATTITELPHHIIFDRVFIHGPPVENTGVGILADGKHVGIIDSTISDIHAKNPDGTGRELQAILVLNSDGPFLFQNNYLEAAGENIMFGGTDPKIPNLVPGDAVVRGNHFYVPDSYAQYAVKNHFELKSAIRVLIEGNVFENMYPDAQRGVSIQFTPRNNKGGSPQSTVEDVIFRNNLVKDVAHFINILGADYNYPSKSSSRILIENNLVYNLDRPDSATIDISAGNDRVYNLTFRHNTMIHSAGGRRFMFIGSNKPSVDRFDFIDNLLTHGQYGIHFDNGTFSDGWAANFTIENNVVSGGNRNVPPNNFVDVPFNSIGFTDPINHDYSLMPSSPYKGQATDQTDIGADINAVMTAIQCAVSGLCSGTQPATYQLTVNSGTGSGQYQAGSNISIAANQPPSGQQFDQWAGNGAAHVADVNAANTIITMPASDITVSANYIAIPNNAPTANNDNRSTSINTPVTFNLLASDPDSNPITFSIVASPQNGSLDTSNLPSVTYTPDTDYKGSDSFTFKVNDGQLDSNTATVSLQISSGAVPPNRPPVIDSLIHNAIDLDLTSAGIQVEEGTTVTYSGSVSDPDDNPVLWEWIYTIDGGPEIILSNGVYPTDDVADISFGYALGTAGKTYTWILRINDGQDTTENTINIEIIQKNAGSGNESSDEAPFKNILDFSRDTRMDIPCDADVRIANRNGQIIRDLHCPVGARSVVWDGKTTSGNQVASGVYILIEESKPNRKVVVIR